MNQVYSGNYQSYQPSYNRYQASSGQWSAYGCQGSNGFYGNHETSASPYESYPRKTPCMGQCNPPKLYADTYNYLTENLMKPVIEEVYQDLKSITAANTIANNSGAAKIGLQTKPEVQGIQQNVQRQDRAMVNAIPLDSSHIQGQLRNVSAVRPNPVQSQFLAGNKSLRSQMGAAGYTQQNAVTSRNGLIQV